MSKMLPSIICSPVSFALQLNTQEGSMHKKEAGMQETSFGA